MTYIRVVAAVVDTRQLTIYKEDGTTVLIPQGDARIMPILDAITDKVSRGEVADLDASLVDRNADIYGQIEKETKGFTRFFRVAKSKLSTLFGANGDDAEIVYPVPPQAVGSISGKLQKAVSDIMANAVHSSSPDFHSSDLLSDETIIAAVGTEDDFKIIPGMENLQPQFQRALKIGSMTGVENFLRRLSAVIDQRGHSIMELLNFMERGDLPIADDGSILAYKALTRSKSVECNFEAGPDIFFDIHSKMVPQRVGSFVCMDAKLVDLSRRTECSTGLHVARRSYLRGFKGDVCVLIKIAPEDVLAVPEREPDKMRVCGYHIIFQIGREDYAKLLNNQAMTDNKSAQSMLGKAIRGEHIGRIEEVRIGGPRGTEVTVKELIQNTAPLQKRESKPASPKLAEALPDKGKETAAPAVDPKAVAEKATKAKMASQTKVGTKEKEASAPAPMTRAEQAKQLYAVLTSKAPNQDRRQAALDLLDLKKTSKIGWAKFGIAPENQSVIEHVSKLPDEPKPVPTPAGMSRIQQARALFQEQDWAGLHALKKKAKVGWERLGFSAKETKEILRHV